MSLDEGWGWFALLAMASIAFLLVAALGVVAIIKLWEHRGES